MLRILLVLVFIPLSFLPFASPSHGLSIDRAPWDNEVMSYEMMLSDKWSHENNRRLLYCTVYTPLLQARNTN